MIVHNKYSSVQPTSDNFDIKTKSDEEQGTYGSQEAIDPSEQGADPETVPEPQIQPSKDLPEPLPKQSLVLTNINQVVVDNSYLGRENEIPELIDEYMEAYLAGRDVPPIRLESNTKKLVDGFHRYKALFRIYELRKQGAVNREDVSKVLTGDLIKVEELDLPENVVPCLVSLNYNMIHGRKASIEDIKAAVKKQFENNPGYTVKELATFLGVSEDTARRYAEEPLRERKQNRDAFVVKSHEEGKTQEQIEKSLKETFPGVRGTSRATVAAILSENRKPQKTDKAKSLITEPSTDSNVPDNSIVVEDTPLEKSLSTTVDDEPSHKSGLTTPETSSENVLPFPNSMKGLDEWLEQMITRLKALSNPEQEEILTNWENSLSNVENRRLSMVSGAEF